MGNELSILSAFCADRDLFEKHSKHFESIDNLEREIKLVHSLIKDYYDKYETQAIAEFDIRAFFNHQYPAITGGETYHTLLSNLYEQEINVNLINDILEQIMEQHYATQIINQLIPVMEGHKHGVLTEVQGRIEGFVNKLRNPPVTNELEPCELTLHDILAEREQDGGLQWPLAHLNETIGDIPRKTLGLIYAFVDSGKTSFGLRTVAHFARQLADTGEYIVYAGNEEAASRMSMRLTQSLLEKSRIQILQDVDAAEKERYELGFSRVKLFDSITDISMIERLLDKWSPRVLFIDQATKVTGRALAKEKEVTAIRKLFNSYRELAKYYNTSIIGVTQGTGEAENRKWLKLSDIYGSRVGIQGELDYAIGIGRIIDDATKENLRYLNIPKNKLLDGDPARFSVFFDRHANIWREV
ncbi:MAG: AAA family ATPase [Candidatus Hodarchaeales archaeon]|jgi:hypothetical protein